MIVVRSQLFEFICVNFHNHTQRIHVGEGRSSEVKPTSGGPQGSVMNMFCWHIYIDDLAFQATHAKMLLFMENASLWISHFDRNEAENVQKMKAKLGRQNTAF